MTATKVMNFADHFANPLGLHPPSPTYERSSGGRVDSIINSYAMERSPTEKWVAESCVGSYIDDRCPTEWEHSLSPRTPQSAQSFEWADATSSLRPIDSLNITDESRIVPTNVAARFATRELNGLRNNDHTAPAHSPTDEPTSPLKEKKLDSTLLRKLFRATIDEKRRVDEALRQTTQDVNARVTAKAGAEARNRRVTEQLSPHAPDDHEILRGIRQSLDEQTGGHGLVHHLPLSAATSEDAMRRGSQDSKRARTSLDLHSSKSSSRKSSFDKSRFSRIADKSVDETAGDTPRRLPSFSYLSVPGKLRALSTTREEGRVKDSGKTSLDLNSARTNKPMARDARTKKRESGIADLQRFLRDTGPIQADSPTLGKPKTGKLSKQRGRDKNKTPHHDRPRNKSAAAAAGIRLSPIEQQSSHRPSTSHAMSVHALEIGLGVVTEEPASLGPSVSKRMNDRARLQAHVDSVSSSRADSDMHRGDAEIAPSLQYPRGKSVDIPRTRSRPALSRSVSRPSSTYKFPPTAQSEEPVSEAQPSINTVQGLEKGWAFPAPMQPSSREVTASNLSIEAPSPRSPRSAPPVTRKASARHAVPKLALKIPAFEDWEEISYAQSVVLQTLTPVSASKVIILKSAGAKSPSVPDFPPLPTDYITDKDYSQRADDEILSEQEDGQESVASSPESSEKLPLERKDSKTPSVEPSPVPGKAWDQSPSQKSNSNWFRDHTSPSLQAFEFLRPDGTAAACVPLKTPQAASAEIQSVVEGWVEAAHEQRTLKLAAAKQVMRAPRSPGAPSAKRASRPTTSLGFREADDDWAPMNRARNVSRSREPSERPKTAAGRDSHCSTKSRSTFSDRRSSAVSGGAFEEFGMGLTTASEHKSNPWAAASARSTKVPIKGMSFRSGPNSRVSSRPVSRSHSRAPSVRSPMPSQKDWGAGNFTFDFSSVRTSQTETRADWPEHREADRTSKASIPSQALRRPSLASTHQSQKSQGVSVVSAHSRRSSAASHHSSTTSYPRSIQAESERSYENQSRLSQYSSLGKQLDGSPVPPLPESPHGLASGEQKKQPATQTTIFAGKGWISPHPLSRSPTELASPPQSKIVLPSEAFPQGATMTYDEWKQIQEAGLRLRHNHSITESSRTHNGVYQDERFRHPGWGSRGTPPISLQGGSNDSAPSPTSRKASTPSILRAHEARVGEQDVSFVTGSVKSSRHQRSNSA